MVNFMAEYCGYSFLYLSARGIFLFPELNGIESVGQASIQPAQAKQSGIVLVSLFNMTSITVVGHALAQD